MLKPGMLADFVLLDRDMRDCAGMLSWRSFAYA